jgi:hypothetical protein
MAIMYHCTSILASETGNAGPGHESPVYAARKDKNRLLGTISMSIVEIDAVE